VSKLSLYFYLEKYLIPPLIKAAEWPPLKALQQGIIKSFYFLLAVIPILFIISPQPHLGDRFLATFRAALSLMAFSSALTVAYYLSLPYKLKPLTTACSSLALFTAFLPHKFFSPALLEVLVDISSSALFIALICALGAVNIFRLIKNTGLGALVILISVFLGHHYLSNLYDYLELPVKFILNTGDSLPVVLGIVILICLLWIGGIHGSLLVNPLILPIYFAILAENARLMHAHNYSDLHIVTSTFFNMVFVGGGGCTLPLALMAAFSRVPRLRKVGRISILPALANINEMLVYGLPVAMNPIFWVPFVFAPLFVTLTTYGAMWLGLVHKPYFYVPGMVPSLISAYLTTGDWKASMLVLINLILVYLFYLPFFKAYEKSEKDKEGEKV
jgi:PTS system cellobiose-specific IIC component